MPDEQSREGSWVEELELDSKELVGKVKELIAAGNVRRVVIRKPNNDILIEIPLTAGVAVGSAAVLFAPTLAAIGALAALIAQVKLQVVRVGAKEPPAED